MNSALRQSWWEKTVSTVGVLSRRLSLIVPLLPHLPSVLYTSEGTIALKINSTENSFSQLLAKVQQKTHHVHYLPVQLEA